MAYITDIESNPHSLPSTRSEPGSTESRCSGAASKSNPRRSTPPSIASLEPPTTFTSVHPRVPAELQTSIIDWVAADLDRNGFGNAILQAMILACMLVCRSWSQYAQQRLHNHVHLVIPKIPLQLLKWRAALKHKPMLSKSLQTLLIHFYQPETSLASILVYQKFSSLQSLHVRYMDIKREPVILYRAAACLTSVHELYLSGLKECTAAQLTRFISPFSSMSRLSIKFDSLSQPLRGTRTALHHTGFCLAYLKIGLIPGISTLIDWLTKPSPTPLVSNLKQLALSLQVEGSQDFQERCKGVAQLFYCCSMSLEELTLSLSGNYTIDEITDLISLSSLSKLQKLTYASNGHDKYTLDWIIKQLGQLTPDSILSVICFKNLSDKQNGDKWAEIDSLLVGERFKALHRVEVVTNFKTEYLPLLSGKKLLVAQEGRRYQGTM